MRTEKITAENADNAEVRALYESAFPKEERIPYDDLKHLLGVMPIDFVTYYDGDRFVGLTWCSTVRTSTGDGISP